MDYEIIGRVEFHLGPLGFTPLTIEIQVGKEKDGSFFLRNVGERTYIAPEEAGAWIAMKEFKEGEWVYGS